MAQFEKFTKALVAQSRTPNVTIQRRGTVALNAAAYALLDSPRAVELLFDRRDQVLGLRACDPALEHAAVVRPAAKTPSGPFVVSAMAFLKYYDVDTHEARRYPVSLRGPVLCIDLTGEFQAVGKRKRTDVAAGTDSPLT